MKYQQKLIRQELAKCIGPYDCKFVPKQNKACVLAILSFRPIPVLPAETSTNLYINLVKNGLCSFWFSLNIRSWFKKVLIINVQRWVSFR